MFKHVKNVNNLIKKTKQDYFKEKVSERKNNSSKLWNSIKCWSKDGNEKKNGISQIIENDAVITENKTIAEIFNCYFIDQPKKILASFGRYQSPSGIGFMPDSSFEISPVVQKDVLELLLSIPSHKATGDDGVSVKVLEVAAPAIAPSLTRVLNLCLSTKHFPVAWKTAKVTPAYKGNGSRDDKDSYRPISVLPILSKLLEKHICRAVCTFLRENKLLYRF